jgi:drug/metabolite transporter (DMT)-like permease
VHAKNITRGLVGVVGIWITAGLALPLVNVLKAFSPEQLMCVRGLMTAVCAFCILRGRVFPVNSYTILSGLGFAGGCLGLYHGIRELGPSLTIIFFTTAPIVNFGIAWYKGKHVSFAAIGSLVVMLGGVVSALQPWSSGNTITKPGVFWCTFGTVSGALFYEALAKAKGSKLVRCFWQAGVVAIVGFFGSLVLAPQILIPDFATTLIVIEFALMGGFLYFLSNIEAFDNLPVEIASVLAQGETPAVILVSGLLLGERLTLYQWLGVIVALCGAVYLSHWISNQKQVKL